MTIRLRPSLAISLNAAVVVSQAAASLRGQNIVVATACKFVRSAADHVSGVPPLRVADEPGWDITEPCICRTEIICGNCLNQWKQLKSDNRGVIRRRLSLAADHSGVNLRSSDIYRLVPESKIVTHYCTPGPCLGHSGARASRMLMKSTALSALFSGACTGCGRGWHRRKPLTETDLGASGRSPTKKLSIVKQRVRVHGRRLSWLLGWHRSVDRSVLGCVLRASGGVAERWRAGV